MWHHFLIKLLKNDKIFIIDVGISYLEFKIIIKK